MRVFNSSRHDIIDCVAGIQTGKLSTSLITKNLLAYSGAHLLVDGTCAALVFSLSALSLVSASIFVGFIVLYDILAFATQPFFGLLIDRLRLAVATSSFGSVLVVLAVPIGLILHLPFCAVVIAGIGNALFHLGGGTIAFNLSPRKATMPGLFVAPGTIGLFLGTLVGKTAAMFVWPFAVVLLIFAALILLVEAPKINYTLTKKREKISSFDMVLVFVLVVIVIRSLMGFAISFGWKSNFALLVALTIGVFLGKALGGVLADRYGWRKVAVGTLIISAPLVSFFGAVPVVAIVGMFLFNMTTPVTLTAVANLFTGRPAFAFGLNCIALIGGALVIFGGVTFFSNPIVSFATILVSALVLFVGLGKGGNIVPAKASVGQ